MQPSVSFALIVRNEEAKLSACLEPVAGIADEMIVVDTGSTDRTKEVAAVSGPRFSISRESMTLPRPAMSASGRRPESGFLAGR